MAGTDEELIAFGAFLHRAMGGGRAITLVAGDMNLHIRAQRAGLATHCVADKYSKEQPEKASGSKPAAPVQARPST